jgi:DNA invertase Pin-like site-specific DNA recombinase
MNTHASPTAVAYFRTSSASNVGADKDTLPRQRNAVHACASSRGLSIVEEFKDDAVSGADSVDSRPGFSDMIAYMLGNGARTIIVENASRFARDLIVQETGYQMLKDRGIELIAADAPDSFLSDTPTSNFIRQVLGAVAELEKAMLVNKLRGARNRKRKAEGRCEGRSDWKSAPAAHVEAARALHARGLSLRAIAAELANRKPEPFLNHAGKSYGAESILLMVDRERAVKQRAARRAAKRQAA